VIDRFVDDFDILRTSATPDFGVWVEGKYNSKKGMFLAHGPEGIMREIFGGLIFVIVWSAPTRTSVLPVKLPLLRILSYSALSRQ
jgi:hypothetical protein